MKHTSSRQARVLGALFVAAAALLPARVAVAASQPITADQYVARLESARALAEADAVQPSPERMQVVRRTVGLPVDVTVHATVVHVENDDFLTALRGASTGDFRKAADHLAAMEDAARAAVTAQPPSRERIAAALHDALRGVRTTRSLSERVRQVLWGILLTLWEWLRSAGRRVSLPPGVLALLAAAILGLVVVVVIRRLRYVVPDRSAGAGARGKSRSPDWDRLAEEALARGDLAAALRFSYGGLLAALAARGVIPDAPSLTAGECRVAVKRGLPGVYPAVSRATSGFEAAFYGRAPVTRDHVDALREAEKSVKAA